MIRYAARSLALKGVIRMDPARLARLQERRLRGMLRHAVEKAPFFRELYRGLDIERAPLAEFPVTTKGLLMEHFDRTVTDPRVRRSELERFVDDPSNEGKLFLDRYIPSHTSGSQGQPMLILQERSAIELFFGLQMTRGNSGEVSVREAVRKFVRPARLAIVTLKRGFYPSASSFEYMPAPARRFVRTLRLSQTDEDLIDRLNAFRPAILTGYAGVLESLALEAESGRLRLGPELRQVVNNSEVLTPKAERRIREAFGVHVMNNYATGECPFLSNGCPAGPGAHVNADWAILEVVDEQNRPVRDGEPGRKVLITNLANRLQPFLRYEVGDIVTMADQPCGCGSRLPRVAHIEGRAADAFWVRCGDAHRQLIGSVFKNAFDYAREVREWQAVQSERNAILVRLELLPGRSLDESHTRDAVDRQLHMYGFQDFVDVRLQVVPKLAADPNSGKFRRMLSLVGPPSGAGEPSTTRVDPAHPDLARPHDLSQLRRRDLEASPGDR